MLVYRAKREGGRKANSGRSPERKDREGEEEGGTESFTFKAQGRVRPQVLTKEKLDFRERAMNVTDIDATGGATVVEEERRGGQPREISWKGSPSERGD